MTRKYLTILLVLCGLLGCDSDRKKNLPGKDKAWDNLIHLSEQIPLGTPRQIVIQSDSLVVSPARGRKIKVNVSAPTRNQLSKVKAGPPIRVKLDTAALDRIIPGRQDYLQEVRYEVPSSEFSVQHGDTIRPPGTQLVKWPVPNPAQSMRFRDASLHDIQFLDVEQGLPSSYVDAIYEDDVGNMWFGTYGGGVSRYDGNTFTTFSVEHGLSNNIVISILKDSRGNLWFGTDGSGVCKFDGHSFTYYSVDQGLAGIYVETMIEDLKGNIWFGTNGGGVSMYSPGIPESFTNYSVKEGIVGNNVWSSLLDVDGNLWFGTRNGLTRYDGKSFINIDKTNGLQDNNVRALYQDDRGRLWIGTEGGVSIYDGTTVATLSKEEGLGNNRIWNISQGKDGNMWLGTDGGGVYKLTLDKDRNLDHVFLTSYTQNEGLSYDFVRSMHADDKGNMWFGVDGGGVSKFKTNSFTSFTNDKNLSANSVWSIFEDHKGNMWFGSDVWGIYKYADGYLTSYMDDEGLLEYSVMDMLIDLRGDMWFATYGSGIIRYDGQSFYSFSLDEGFPNLDVYSMLEDQNGNLWFGTQGSGLVKYDGDNFITYSQKDGLANDRIWQIYEDSKGYIWVGTFGGGVSKFDGTSFTTYDETTGLINNSVNSIFEDHEGSIWLGTDEGLNKLVFEDAGSETIERLYYLTSKDGLTNSITLSLIEDDDHVIWIGTEGGITSLLPVKDSTQKVTRDYRINAFVQLDGLKGLDVVINSVCLDRQNRMWWGTGKGLTMLDIGKRERNDTQPQLQLNSILIEQEFVDYRNLKNSTYRDGLSFGESLYPSIDSIVPFKNYPKVLNLPHHLNHLSFNFSAIDWQAIHKVKYQYKLEGLDEDWSSPSKNITAEYRNLDYGKYTFMVRAIGTAGVWSETIAYPFTVQRPWWHTWWARLLYILFGLVCLISFDRWRTFRILRKQKELQLNMERRNRELEAMVLERTAEIKRQQQMTEEANMALEQKVEERTRELIDKNKKLSDYAFVNAHSLRVPVANIKGIIQLFELVKSPKEKEELIELLKGQSNTLDDVLFDIKEMLEKDHNSES